MNINNPFLRGICNQSRSLLIAGAFVAGTVLSITFAAGISPAAPPAELAAKNDDAYAYTSEVRIGFRLAPVPLNLRDRNFFLVGLGSYIVNAVAGCNDCHSAGPQSQYVAGGNPFFGQRPPVTNPVTYLGGGRDFGPLTPNSPHIVSRNLTPDKTGKPGGDTFFAFLETMRTGADPDHVHPTCSGTSATSCLPAPFDGDLLQIMPWPAYRNLTNQYLSAIYEYLSALPCVEGGPGQPSHRCN